MVRGILLALWVTMTVMAGSAGAALPEALPKKASPAGDIETRQLKEIVSLLEDPVKREAFLRDLKALIKLREAGLAEPGKAIAAEEKKAPAEKPLLPIEGLFLKFESVTRRLGRSSTEMFALAKRTPEAYTKTKAFFSSRTNRSRLMRLILCALIAVLSAAFIRVMFRGPIRRLSQPSETLLGRCLRETAVFLLRLAPYGASLVALFILMPIFPSFESGQGALLLFLWVLFFYRLVLLFSRALLHPEDPARRILSLTDESAAYFWVWCTRFANYSLFYFLVTGLVQIAGMSKPDYHFLRGVLLLGFPIMITILILQLAREARARLSQKDTLSLQEKVTLRTLKFIAIRYAPLLGVIYCWAVFTFIIVRYQSGFSYLFQATIGTAIVAAAFLWLRALTHKAFERFFAISEQVRARFPGMEQRANRYIIIFRKGIVSLTGILALAVVAQFWGIPISSFIASREGSIIIFRAVAMAVTAVIVLMIWEGTQVVRRVIMDPEQWARRQREPSQKTKTLVPLICTAVKIGAAFVGGIVVLDQMGVNVNPILAGAGIVGLAVGFGSQTLVKDLINGLFFLFEESIRVGDVVVIGDKGGLVENVGLRTVKIRDLAGNVHVIPNSSIDRVMNMTKDFSRYVFDVGVAYREDVDEVMEILREIGDEMQKDPKFGPDILEPLEILGVDRFEDSAVIIRARITTRPLRQWSVGREFNRRMKKVFDERGIEIPFPHRTIYMGEPKEGTAPPLQIRMIEEPKNPIVQKKRKEDPG